MKEIITTNQGNNMNIDKYIKEATSKTELLAYKLLLNTQIIEAQRSLDLIELQLHKIELREANDIEIVETVGGGFEI